MNRQNGRFIVGIDCDFGVTCGLATALEFMRGHGATPIGCTMDTVAPCTVANDFHFGTAMFTSSRTYGAPQT